MKKQPDKTAFLALIQENKRIIYKICNSYCRNQYDREDLAQEIIYQLWRSGESFQADHKFSTWMYRIALNTAISFYRKEQSAGKTVELSEQVLAMKEEGSELEENIRQMQQFINDFNELDRALILLYLEKKNHKEIAEILGISESNVGTKISRMKEKLRQRFSNQ